MAADVARTLSDRLAHAARRVAELELLEPGCTVELSTRASDRERNAIDVHGLSPLAMEHASRMDGADAHRDADGILKWVSFETDALELTYYRR
jgi:hypothetical protein